MSGICGIIHLDGRPVERAELERMAERAAYRGPNGIEYYLDGPVGISCLSLDITPDGTGKCSLVVDVGRRAVFAADARLDNRGSFADLAVTSSTDAEVMLAALLRYGEQGAERLIGDFAYTLWDSGRCELRLARDGMGMRSLYYRVESKRVLFATEVKQILAADGVPRKLNEQAVAWYLCGMQVPPGVVFYQGIEEVKPAEEVLIDREGRVKQRVFWSPDPKRRIRYRDEREYTEHFRELFIEAVRCRLRARSPVGISLSGGMDSGSVASVAGWLREQGENVPTMRAYTWAFKDFPECDERENTYRIANRCHFPVQEIPAEDTYPLVDISLYEPDEDEPFSIMYQSFLIKCLDSAVSENCSAMFYGDRGDVVCGNYLIDLPGVLITSGFSQALNELVAVSRLFNRSIFSSLSHYFFRPIVSGFIGIRLESLLRSAMNFHSSKSFWPGEGRGGVAGPSRLAASHVNADFIQGAGLGSLMRDDKKWRPGALRQRYSAIFAPFAMRGSLYTERLCAHRGVGYGDPWSDRRIAEFVLSCPQGYINRAGHPKRIARQAMQGIMSEHAINSAGKISPEPLYLAALRNHSYKTVTGLINNSICARNGYVDEFLLCEKFEDFVRGAVPIFDLWSTLSIEIWLRRYWS